MNIDTRKNAELVFACFSMFLLLVGITFYPIFIPDKIVLMQSGLLLPLLYILEFCFIFPLYVVYFRKINDMGKGDFGFKQFLVFLVLVLLAQLAGAYIMNVRKNESWMVEQEAVKGGLFWLNFLLLVFVVPVYEEVVFRGCLLTALFTFFRGNIYFASLATSALFSVLHTQYADVRSFIILYVVSVILIIGRIVSRGLYMPILLHMAMNGIILSIEVLIK